MLHVCMCIKGFLNSHPPSAKLIPTESPLKLRSRCISTKSVLTNMNLILTK